VPGFGRAFVLIPDPIAVPGDGGRGRRKGMNQAEKWKEKIGEWWYYQVDHRLAGLAILIGALRSRWAFLALCEIAPRVAGLALLLNEMNENVFIWYREEGEPCEGKDPPAELMEELEELIVRSPSPMGADEYLVTVQRRGLLSGEKCGARGSRKEIHASVWDRPLLASESVAGDRYYDWRKGGGKSEFERLLRWADPLPESPMTVILVAFTGKALAHMSKEMARGEA
jgi:hypothetical protein